MPPTLWDGVFLTRHHLTKNIMLCRLFIIESLNFTIKLIRFFLSVWFVIKVSLFISYFPVSFQRCSQSATKGGHFVCIDKQTSIVQVLELFNGQTFMPLLIQVGRLACLFCIFPCHLKVMFSHAIWKVIFSKIISSSLS